jgi:hypothetical protein
VALVLLIAGFFSLYAYHSSELAVTLGFIPVVAGVAILFNSVVNATMVLAPPQKVGAQNGTLTVFQEVGQSIAAAVAGAALVSFLDPVSAVPTSQAYAVICFVGIGLAAVGFVVLARTPRLTIPDTPAAHHLH